METLVYAVEVGSARPLAVRESVPPVLPKPRLLDRVREALRVRHYSRRTEEAYVASIRRYNGRQDIADGIRAAYLPPWCDLDSLQRAMT
jgi:hypothetical protein